jgi:DNA-binding NtrC family response regulator
MGPSHEYREYRPADVRILVVDDDPDLRLTLDDFLSSRGFRVVSARTGADAIKLLGTSAFDIVVTDLIMPGVDGLAVLRAARESNPLTDVIVMTGYSSLKAAIESIRCGAFDYLAKPFELVQIEIVVSRIMEHQRLAAENRRLSRQLSLLTKRSESVEVRLGAIEALLSSLVANFDNRAKVLTTLDI